MKTSADTASLLKRWASGAALQEDHRDVRPRRREGTCGWRQGCPGVRSCSPPESGHRGGTRPAPACVRPPGRVGPLHPGQGLTPGRTDGQRREELLQDTGVWPRAPGPSAAATSSVCTCTHAVGPPRGRSPTRHRRHTDDTRSTHQHAQPDLRATQGLPTTAKHNTCRDKTPALHTQPELHVTRTDTPAHTTPT